MFVHICDYSKIHRLVYIQWVHKIVICSEKSIHCCEIKLRHSVSLFQGLKTYKEFQDQKVCQAFKARFCFPSNTHHWCLGDLNLAEAPLRHGHEVTVLREAAGPTIDNVKESALWTAELVSCFMTIYCLGFMCVDHY